MLMTTMPRAKRPVFPAAEAAAMYAPRPDAVSVALPQVTTSDTMLAFQAPPLAVIAPVTHDAKMPGIMKRFQRNQPVTSRSAVISRSSVGMLCAPAIVLKRTYHCAPSAIKRMQPQLIGMWYAMKNSVANGKIMLAGNDARNCTTG